VFSPRRRSGKVAHGALKPAMSDSRATTNLNQPARPRSMIHSAAPARHAVRALPTLPTPALHSIMRIAANEERTAKRVSDALGAATEMRASKNYAGHRLSPWLGHLMVWRQETARPLLTPGEVMRLPPGVNRFSSPAFRRSAPRRHAISKTAD
jgi:type IV secretory system conjugative DNA transfer VirD4/TraG family protein